MLANSQQQRLRKLLSETIPLMCKNSLGCNVDFSIEAFIGITVASKDATKNEAVIISFKEAISADGHVSSCIWSETPSPRSRSQVADSSREPISTTSPLQKPANSHGVTKHEAVEPVHGNLDHGWGDYSYWSEQYHTPLNTVGPFTAENGSDRMPELASVPLKFEQNEDCIEIEDEPLDFKTVPTYAENKSDVNDSYKGHYLHEFQYPGSGIPPLALVPPPAHSDRHVHIRQSSQLPAPDVHSFKSIRGQPQRKSTQFSSSPSPKVKRLSTASARPVSRSKLGAISLAPAVASAAKSEDSYRSIVETLCDDAIRQSSQMFVCHLCRAQLTNARTLREHVRGIHLSIDKYSCELCQQSFRWFIQLHRHRKRYHADLYPPTVPAAATAAAAPACSHDQPGDDADQIYDDDGNYYE